MHTQYVIALTWIAGFFLSRWMLQVEHEAEGNEYTNGDNVSLVLLSALSFAMVLFLLIKAWGVSVRKYWSKPAKRPGKETKNHPAE
jgi:hypothetical protein